MLVDKITIATTQTTEMITFYNRVFDTKIVAIPQSPLFKGKLGNVELMMCPNTILGINAEKNNIQFRVFVDDLEPIIELVIDNGGEIINEPVETETDKQCGILDPDGNSIELMAMK